MVIELSWLRDLISHPIVSALIGAIVGGLFTWAVFIKRINWEAMTNHFEDLKKHVIEPLIKESSLIDDRLLDDLFEEHYPELKAMNREYIEAQAEEKKREEKLRKEINERVETLLKKFKIKYKRNFQDIPDICITSFIVDSIFRILDLNDWFFNIKIETSGNFFVLKIDGAQVFKTSNENKAYKVKDTIDMIMKKIVVQQDLNEQVRQIKELRKDMWDKHERLLNALKDLRRKTKLKLRKRFRIFPRPCKYLKGSLD